MDGYLQVSMEDVELLGRDLQLYFAGAASLLFYDYLLTLADEVEYAWKEKKGLAYFSPLFTPERCIVIFLALIMGAQSIVVVVAMSDPHLNGYVDIEPFHICILYSDLKMDIAYLSLSILFDVIVFGLTVYLTFNPTNQSNALSLVAPKASLLQTIQRDGLLYFCTILSGNLVWLLMVIFARSHVDNGQSPDPITAPRQPQKYKPALSPNYLERIRLSRVDAC
ncbi:hypothetical protein WG66_009420 [Moniliophthora roreri]|nr:hypothetical protein WG66_009420 [Moniliophthora roreri]